MKLYQLICVSALIAVAYAANSCMNLSCPVPATFFPTNRSEPICTSNRQCGPTQLCCNWFITKHCLEGISTVDKPGTCPAQVRAPVGSVRCIADFAGCQYDAECSGAKKCCRDVNCGYRQCQAPTPLDPPRPCTRRGCGAQAGSDCVNVELVRPNGPGCGPVCRVCRDRPTVAPPTISPSALVCPRYPFYFSNRNAESNCLRDSDCAANEKCCYWGGPMRCRVGVDPTPKPGVCPAISPLQHLARRGCRMDYVGCQHDSQCRGRQKCCQSASCGYFECTAVVPSLPAPTPSPRPCTEIGCGPQAGPDCVNVELVRPNGPGCEPVCRVCRDRPTIAPPTTPRPCTEIGCGPQAGPDCVNVELVRPNGPGCQPVCRVCRDRPTIAPPTNPPSTLVCPRYPFYFSNRDRRPACTVDADCALNEKCCRWGGPMRCQPGVDTTPKPGSCPAGRPFLLRTASFGSCRMDYVGCQHDSQCRGSMKCCRSTSCPYFECTAAVNPILPIHTPLPRPCTKIGCGSQAGSDCVNVELVRPNGPGCEPVCRVCRDRPTIAPPTNPPRVCTEIGCGPAPGPECRRVVDFRPNGPGCAPVCRMCADADVTTTAPSREGLMCPSYPFFFNVPITDPCAADTDCAATEKCCRWGRAKQCRAGVVTRPKEGVCPAISTSDCIADFPGCDYDSECPGSQKCCRNQHCGYKQCAVLPTRVPEVTCRRVRTHTCRPADPRDPNSPQRCGYISMIVCDMPQN